MDEGFGHLQRLSDVSRVDVLTAVQSQAECAALLDRLAALSASDGADGSAVLVALFDQLAIAGGSGWLEGDLAVELFEEDDGTRVRVMSELGAGLREQVLPTVCLRARLADLTSGPEPVALALEIVSSRCAMLLSAEPVPTSTEFEISQTCLAIGPHEDVDAGWDV